MMHDAERVDLPAEDASKRPQVDATREKEKHEHPPMKPVFRLMTHRKPRRSQSSNQRRLALSRWENEGGAVADGAQTHSPTVKMQLKVAQTNAQPMGSY
jgi:hypothetical protein